MYGHPADREFANQCWRLWGVRQGRGGPQGYPRDAAFVPKAKGIPIDWHNDIVEKVGDVFAKYLDADEQRVVSMFYKPYPDETKEGELICCNTSFVMRRCKKIKQETGTAVRLYGKDVKRGSLDTAIDRAITRVQMIVSSPGVNVNAFNDEADENKVCNF